MERENIVNLPQIPFGLGKLPCLDERRRQILLNLSYFQSPGPMFGLRLQQNFPKLGYRRFDLPCLDQSQSKIAAMGQIRRIIGAKGRD